MPSRKVVLILLGIFLVLTVLRESGIVTIHYFRSYMDTWCESSWNYSANSMTLTVGEEEMWVSDIDSSCNFYGRMEGYPIVITYDHEHYGDTSECSGVDVMIDDVFTGAIWVPLYKSANLMLPFPVTHQFD